MNLPEEVRQAAEELGRSLGASYAVQSYLAAQAQADASALDNRFQALYQDLLARQRAGEELPQENLNEFYRLREQVQTHPLIVERDLALGELKAYFADVALELSVQLQMDYPTLAQVA